MWTRDTLSPVERALVGLAAVASNFVFVDWLLGTPFAAITSVVVLLFLPPKWDPSIQIKVALSNRRVDKLPECFGSTVLLTPQDKALNGCHDCDHRGGCRELSLHRVKGYTRGD